MGSSALGHVRHPARAADTEGDDPRADAVEHIQLLGGHGALKTVGPPVGPSVSTPREMMCMYVCSDFIHNSQELGILLASGVMRNHHKPVARCPDPEARAHEASVSRPLPSEALDTWKHHLGLCLCLHVASCVCLFSNSLVTLYLGPH